jgi:amidase
LPVGIKDTTVTAGLRTTFGSPLYRDHVPAEDALVVERFRRAGAVILGKTNTPEFAAGGNTWNEVFGRTRNPWNPERSAGGSTGGGAAGLATGMISFAEGTDLGGSLRIPASFCGIVGLRPSPGLVPKHPCEDLWDDLEVTGTMARTAEDVALSLQALAGPSRRSPVAQPTAGRDFVGAVRAGLGAGVEVAYCPDVAGIGVDGTVDRVCRRALDGLRAAGCEVTEVDFDLDFARPAFLALRGLWMVTQQHKHLDRIDELGVNVAANTRAGLEVTTRELAAASHARDRVWELFRRLFERHDYLLTPTMAVPPFPVEENYPATVAGREMETYVDWIAPTFVLSLAGLPIGSVPAGLDPEGLPVGLQIVGRPRDEESVLTLAAAVQEACPVGLPDPG